MRAYTTYMLECHSTLLAAGHMHVLLRRAAWRADILKIGMMRKTPRIRTSTVSSDDDGEGRLRSKAAASHAVRSADQTNDMASAKTSEVDNTVVAAKSEWDDVGLERDALSPQLCSRTSRRLLKALIR